MKQLRLYSVTVDKYGEAIYAASSPQGARAEAWRSWKALRPDLSFNAFAKISEVRKMKSERAA